MTIRSLPLITDLSKCSNSVHKIYTETDIGNWINSEAYEYIEIMIERLNAAVEGKTVEDPCVESATVNTLVTTLHTMAAWIDEIPLDTGPQRFGNKAYRVWHKRMEDSAEEVQQSIVSIELQPILPELIHHFTTCFGSAPRLDYGTGHELSFLAYLLILRLVGILTEADEQAMVTRVFVAYLDVVRKLQKVYKLEPAGSKGVWGLDDHQHLVYIWGASQLKTHPSLHPSSVLTPNTISPHGVSYLFLSSILHVRELKTGPFAEHSPMLNNIASTVPNWTKVNTGLIKMYQEEVLKKLPVVQHFWFGGLLAWRDKTTGEVLESSGDGKEDVEETPRELITDEGAVAPWSIDTVAPCHIAQRPSLPSPLTSSSTTFTSSGPITRYIATPPAYVPTRAPTSFVPPALFPGSSTRSVVTPELEQTVTKTTLADAGGAAAISSPFGVLPPATLRNRNLDEK